MVVRFLAVCAVVACLVCSATARQTAVFAAPDRLWAAQTSPTDITLSWQRVPGALEYRLYAIEDGQPRQVGTTRASGDRFVQRVKAYDVPHRYAIEAIAENGAVSTRAAFNVVVPVKVTPGAVPPPASATAAPEGEGAIAVRWDAVADATAYTIGRAVAPGGFRVICSLCPANTTTFRDAATTPGAKHTYTVVALTPRGASRPARTGQVVPVGTAAAASEPASEAAGAAPKGTIDATPRPGACLSLGQEGNFIVRLADGSVRIFERVLNRRRGASFAKDPTLEAVPGISDAVAVATSGEHWLVLRSDGTILSWGNNSQGQLGSEAAIDRTRGRPMTRPVETPSPVRDITSAVAIAAGYEHSVALLADGSVRTWGAGSHGIPGDGRFDTSPLSALPRLAPTRVQGIENATAVAASGQFSFALLADGSIRAWGRNDMMAGTHGVLGTGSDESTAVPLPVAGIQNATAVAAGSGGVAAAVLADGTVRAWGHGYGPRPARGQAAANRPLPIAGITGAVAISTYMALLRDGTVREFGGPWPWSTPKLDGVVAIASDHVNRIALLDDGRLVAWGRKEFYPDGLVVRGELGEATARACATGPPSRVR
jgi:hypothetical protein